MARQNSSMRRCRRHASSSELSDGVSRIKTGVREEFPQQRRVRLKSGSGFVPGEASRDEQAVQTSRRCAFNVGRDAVADANYSGVGNSRRNFGQLFLRKIVDRASRLAEQQRPAAELGVHLRQCSCAKKPSCLPGPR